MRSLKKKIDSRGISASKISRATGVNKATVFAYINGRPQVTKKARRILRDYFISIGILPPRKIGVRCTCPACGKCHVQAKQSNNRPQD